MPLPHLFDASSATSLEYPHAGQAMQFPGIQFRDHVIWGLTLRVLGTFAAIVRRPLPVPA